MSVKPILFNANMVKAILDGRKTVTRRIIKTQPTKEQTYCLGFCVYGDQKDIGKFGFGTNQSGGSILYVKPPYQPGDTLYVRETFFWSPCWDCGYDMEENRQCPEDAFRRYNADRKEYGCYCYKASMEKNEFPSVDTYHPSIHMPKEIARIWLKVTDVRVERLQDITEEQAQAEGCMSGMLTGPCTARQQFEEIWNSTVKKEDIKKYGWKANPWVWVIAFEQCESMEDIR